MHVRYESFSKLSDLKKNKRKMEKQKMNAKEGCSGEEKERAERVAPSPP